MTLGRLRVRLTLWYAATFALILLLLGAGLFVAIGTQVSRRIDASLVAATAAIKRATHVLEAERAAGGASRSEEHTSELQSQSNLVCRLLLEKKKKNKREVVTPVL